MNAFMKCKKKKKKDMSYHGYYPKEYIFYGSKIEYKKKDSSQPSMIAKYACKVGKYVAKKRTRERRPMNGNASTVEQPSKKASNEVKAGEASFKIYRLLQV